MRRVALAIGLTAIAAALPSRASRADVSLPAPMPARYLRTLAHDPGGYDPQRTSSAGDLLLGDLLFHSPHVLGPRARAMNLSCQSCHPNGATHTTLSIPGVSNRPGNVDLSTAHFRVAADDGVANAVNIPSLRGVRFTSPYGHDGRVASLAEFAQGVVTSEFGGAPLPPPHLAALVRYLHDLDFLPNAMIDTRGRLTARASETAKRGEVLFAQPRAGFGGGSCATCHVPSTFFRDGKVHRVGSGRRASPHSLDDGVETPTLLGTIETAPYFHDGRLATLADVVAWFDQSFELKLSTQARADLTAYVEAVGAVSPASDDRPLAQQMTEGFAYLLLLTTGEATDDRTIWLAAIDLALQALRPGEPRAVSARVSAARAALGSIRARAAREALDPLRPAVRALHKELVRLAADWAGALPSLP